MSDERMYWARVKTLHWLPITPYKLMIFFHKYKLCCVCLERTWIPVLVCTSNPRVTANFGHIDGTAKKEKKREMTLYSPHRFHVHINQMIHRLDRDFYRSQWFLVVIMHDTNPKAHF